MTPERVLIVAHGHPDLQKGGAEVAACNLHRALRAQGTESLLIARTHGPSHGGSAFSSRSGTDELLVHTDMQDAFDFRARDPHVVGLEFGAMLRRFRPTIVHFQHYVHLGLEWIHVARRVCPDAKLVLTLHEYLALCHHGGQMLKRPGLELCYRSNPDDCTRCFPDRGGADFFLRREFIRSAFALVDHFIAPSHFLKQRYVEWGLGADRIEVLENVHPAHSALPPRHLAPGELRGRFAFFGQANVFKGLDLALEAFLAVPTSLRKQVHFDLHAANIDAQPAAFRDKLGKLLHAARHIATMHGPYEAPDLPRRMANTDWVLVPSIWWENSPMVIQEAFGHGRPVLCGDIGGMAEKVRHGVDGWHFPARDARALASTITHLVTHEGIWDRLQAGVEAPLDAAEITRRHLALYGRLRPERAPVEPPSPAP